MDSPASTATATNYGSLGATVNGTYQPGSQPASVGPNGKGFGPASYACNFNPVAGGYVDCTVNSGPGYYRPNNTWWRGSRALPPTPAGSNPSWAEATVRGALIWARKTQIVGPMAATRIVIVLAGNHDADVLWPKVQLAIARVIAPTDPSRLIFVAAAAYEHGGVHIEHGPRVRLREPLRHRLCAVRSRPRWPLPAAIELG